MPNFNLKLIKPPARLDRKPQVLLFTIKKNKMKTRRRSYKHVSTLLESLRSPVVVFVSI